MRRNGAQFASKPFFLGKEAANELVEVARMVHVLQMGQFMDDDVIDVLV